MSDLMVEFRLRMPSQNSLLICSKEDLAVLAPWLVFLTVE